MLLELRKDKLKLAMMPFGLTENQNKNKPVLCVGLVCIDNFFVVEKYPEEDSDQPASKAFKARGGNAANNCTVLAQILQDVTFLGTLPMPTFGNQYEFVFNDFKANNVKVSENCPIRHGASWPEAVVILSQESGSRTIVYNPGEQEPLKASEFALALESIPSYFKWIHFEAQTFVKDMLSYLRSDRNAESTIISIEIEKANQGFECLIPYGDVIFISKDVSEANGARSLREALNIFKMYQRKPKSRLICTWGKKGAGAVDQDGQVLFVQAEHVTNILDSCGAGDTFIACVIASLINERSLKTALETGCRIAAKKIGQRGYQNLGDLFL